MKQIVKEKDIYQTPQIVEMEMYMEGVLCGSQNGGSASGLGKEDMGDIFC